MIRYTSSMPTVETDRKRLARLGAVAAPAAGITAGLFFAMLNLIAEDEFHAPDLIMYDLPPFVEQETPEKPIPPARKPKRPDTILPPPSPPKLVNSVTAPAVAIDLYTGAAPANYGEAILKEMMPITTRMVVDRYLQPISPPIPHYPSAAVRQELEGECDVELNVSPKGEPFNIVAKCSHPAFERAAKRSIEKVRFAPQIRQGLPVTVTGVVYPLEFRLKQ